MTSFEVLVSSACVLASLNTEVRTGDGVWEEVSKLEVVSEGACDRVMFRIPWDSDLVGARARIHSDRGRTRVDDDHWSADPADLAGDRIYTLHVPELSRGGSVEITLAVNQESARPFRWQPTGFAWAELDPPRDRQATPFGDLSRAGRSWWTRHTEGAEVRVHWGDPAAPPLPPLTPEGTTGLGANAALADASTMLLLPRGVDGPNPVSGPLALRRAAADDRGFARTVVGLASGGPDRVVHGYWLVAPVAEGLRDAEDGEVALWVHDDHAEVLYHPSQPHRGGTVWTADGTFEIATPEPDDRDPYAEATRELPRLTHQQVSVLDIPKGDPRTRLYPGGGSRRLVRRAIGFPVDGRARAYALTLPDAVGDIALSTDPPNAAEPLWTMRLRERDGVLVVGPTPYPFTVLAEWIEPDPPACEVVQADAWHRTGVEAPEGEIVWDTSDSWHLRSWRDKPVIPGIDRLIAALDRRFDAYSMPEPALPVRWKNATPTWDLPGELREVMFERSVPGDLPQRTGWPRPLYKARASGALTNLEAALILRLYLVQSDMPTTWAMVRPAWEGPGRPVCPAAYTEALVRVDWEGESRWIDAGCTVCGPWELRPHLEGAAAIGPDVEQTPPHKPGAWTVRVSADAVEWTLEGPAALRLREWLQTKPPEGREARMAERMAGPGATLLEHAGIGDPGTPIRLVARRPDGPFAGEDPLELPPPMPEGFTWFDWAGTRRLIHAGDAEPGEVKVKGAHYTRTRSGDEVTETLHVASRHLDAEAADALGKAR